MRAALVTKGKANQIGSEAGALARDSALLRGAHGSLGGTSAPLGVADRRRQAMRLGTRDQAIPQAICPPEGRAGIPRLVPIFRNALESV